MKLYINFAISSIPCRRLYKAGNMPGRRKLFRQPGFSCIGDFRQETGRRLTKLITGVNICRREEGICGGHDHCAAQGRLLSSRRGHMVLIKNGTVHDGKGQVYQSDILVEAGKIAEIGRNLEGRKGEIYDAGGKLILPGFIDSLNKWACLGKIEQDLSEHSDPVSPHLDVVYSFDPESMLKQNVYEYGITAAGITPSTMNV